MAAVKPPRHGPSMDMTAMCDVAFLILTFFIMTSSFKSEESVTIQTPSSVAEELLPEADVATITIDPTGYYYFGITNSQERAPFAAKLSEKFNLGLTNADLAQFSTLAEVGVPMKSLKQYLALSDGDRERMKLTGIPLDSTNTELVDWIDTYTRDVNTGSKLAIRGDQSTQYPAIKTLFDELGKADINKFQLITSKETN
ncbi:MAG: biopolymer transporter ExbD [Spirosomaceae bacterium]|nr:biopolymer transporter ExbD [Spirosomataceae bacterium]